METIYKERFEQKKDELHDLYMQLYGNDAMFAELCEHLYAFYKERSEKLKTLDKKREADPLGPLSKCFHTKFITTSPIAQMPDSEFIRFDAKTGRELSHADSQSVNTLLHTISDFERISDHSVNLLESAEEMHQKNIEFSKDAQEELQVLEDAVQDILSRTTDAFRKGDLHLASKVEPLEAVVNELVRAIKAHHIARLQTGSCSIEYGFVLDDLLTNYERVCDHCSNVAVAQIEVAQDSFDTHAYLNDLRHGKDTKESEEFHRRLDKYRERYLFPDNQSAEEFDK